MTEAKELPAYMVDFIQTLSASGRSSVTVKQYSSDLKPFAAWLENRKKIASLVDFKSLSSADVISYLHAQKAKGYTAATIRRHGSVINRLRRFYGLDPLGVIHIVSEVEPLRKLSEQDFINDLQFRKLLKSIKAENIDAVSKAISRNVLIDRNLAIVFLMRYFGLTPSEIHHLNMIDLNLSQGVLNLRGRPVKLKEAYLNPLRSYIHSIPKLFRPKYNTQQPVFIAFNNVSMSFQYDYFLGEPKRLSVRAIQSMLMKEMEKAGLHGMSALHLRNTCILESLNADQSSEELATHFGLNDVLSLRRYIEFKTSRE
jgi:site-specific recombinase XerD